MGEKLVTFTTVLHPAKKKLGISTDEYILLDIILKLEKNAKHAGWCYASREYLANCLDIQRPSVSRMLSRLEKQGLVEIEEKSRFIKTTLKFSSAVTYFQTHSNTKLHDVTESYTPCNPKLHEAVTEGYIDNNKDINTYKEKKSEKAQSKTSPSELPYPLVKFNYNKKKLEGLEESHIAELCEKYEDVDVVAELKKLSDWALINRQKVSGRKNGLYPTIVNWLRRTQTAYEEKVGYHRSKKEAKGEFTGKIYLNKKSYEQAVKRGEKNIKYDPNATITYSDE